MDAPDEAAVVARLQRDGHVPLKAEPAAKRRGLPGLGELLTLEIGRGQALSRGEVTGVTRELAVMLGAGQDLDRALRFITETAPGKRVAAVVGQVRDAVRDGAPLATALAQHPRSFTRLYIGLVRAGEAGGSLAPTLERLADLLEEQRRLSSTITSALIYPAMLLVAAIGSIVLLLTQVLPQFVPMFEQNGAHLPASTQFLIDAGDAVGRFGPAAFVILIVGGLILRNALRRPGPRLQAARLVLRVPVLGGLMRELLAARFTRTLGTLLINGVPLVAALGIVRDAVGNAAGTAAVDEATASAKGGAGLSRSLAESHVMPDRTIYLLRLGEETGQLGAMALRAASIHEEKTRLSAQRLVSLLVPTITIVMGGVIGGIVSSLLLAMLSLNDLAQ
jgi:general secretion pathway protein F